MNVYTYTEARQNLAKLLDQAAEEGEVMIRRRDGKVFVVKVQPQVQSPLDVEGVDLGISTDEILAFIEEGRRLPRE